MTLRDRFSKNGTQLSGEFVPASVPDIAFMLHSADLDRGNARASRVNRTHRVVQERAKTIAARRSKIRSLWLPLLLFSVLLVGICIAVWVVVDEYEIAAAGTPGGIQAASYQWLVPLFWSIPVSAALLAVVWFRKTRGDTGRGPGE